MYTLLKSTIGVKYYGSMHMVETMMRPGTQFARQLYGGYIISGTTESYGAGGKDVYLQKTDSLGFPSWNATCGGEGYNWGTCVSQTNDGGFIAVGYTSSFDADGNDGYLVGTDSLGDSL